MKACAALYQGPKNQKKAKAATLTSPLVSPLFGDLHGLPPVLIQIGSDELLLKQGLELETRLQAAGVQTVSEVIQGHWHVAQMHVGILSSADAALDSMSQFVKTIARKNFSDRGKHHKAALKQLRRTNVQSESSRRFVGSLATGDIRVPTGARTDEAEEKLNAQ